MFQASLAEEKRKTQEKLNKRLEERKRRKKEQKVQELEEQAKNKIDLEEAEAMKRIAEKGAKDMDATEKMLASQEARYVQLSWSRVYGLAI